jgi:hypothetical protein
MKTGDVNMFQWWILWMNDICLQILTLF